MFVSLCFYDIFKILQASFSLTAGFVGSLKKSMSGFKKISAEDSMLLAMIIDDLSMESESRSESWIVQHQNPDASLLISESSKGIRPVWLAKLCGVIVRCCCRRDTKREARRIRALLPSAVEERLLVSSKRHDGMYYSVTDTGKKWSEDLYSELGKERLHDSNRLTRLADASELRKTLVRHGSDMPDAELRNTAFPPMDWDTEDRVGLRAQQQAYNATLPVIFERAICTAIQEGWISEVNDRYRLTSTGRSTGAVYFDNWR